MRVAQILTPALIALATAACARQQASYYAIDPTTQQPVAQRYTPSPPQYAQAPAASHSRGLFSSPQLAQRSYAQAGYGQPAYQPPQPQQDPSGRGLFNTFANGRASYPPPAYAQAAYPQQAYAPPQPAAQPAYPQRAYAQPSYAQQPQQRYARPPAAQYQQPNYGTGGPYVAARTSNPFAQARWY